MSSARALEAAKARSRGNREGSVVGLVAGGTVSAAAAAVAVGDTRGPKLMGALLAGVTVATLPLWAILSGVLAVRNLSDPAVEHGQTVSAGGVNLSAAIGLFVIVITPLRLWLLRRPVGAGLLMMVAALLAGWTLVAIANYGYDASLGRELVRALSIVCVGVLAANTPQFRDRRVVWAIILAGVIPAAAALLQLAGAIPTGTVGNGRARGTLAHPNTAATLFAITLTLSIWLAMVARDDRRERAVAVGIAVLTAAALGATGGIGGVVQALVSIAVLTSVAAPTKRAGQTARAIAAGLALAFIMSPLGTERINELGTTQGFSAVAATGDTTNSVDWRFYNWSVYLQYWEDRPVLGNGLGVTQSLLTPLGGLNTHSDLVRLLVEAGLIGTLVFGGLAGVLVVRLWRLRTPRAGEVGLPAVALAVLAGTLVHTFDSTVSEVTAPMYSVAVLIGAAASVRTT